MTAFATPDYGSPEAANRRLVNAAFLQTRDLQFYDHMVLEIRRLSHTDENIPIPDSAEMGAWGRAYALYEKLRDRAAVEEQRAVQGGQWFVEDQKAWNEYGENLETVKAMLKRGILDEDTLTEHLDIQLPDDLSSPVTPEPNKYGSNRHPAWKSRAQRLSSALHWWHALGAEARAAIKQQRALRQLQALKEERAHG